MNLAKLKEVEDEVKTALDKWDRLRLLIAFAYIKRGSNISMDGIDRAIVEAFKKTTTGVNA